MWNAIATVLGGIGKFMVRVFVGRPTAKASLDLDRVEQQTRRFRIDNHGPGTAHSVEVRAKYLSDGYWNGLTFTGPYNFKTIKKDQSVTMELKRETRESMYFEVKWYTRDGIETEGTWHYN